MSGDLYGAVFQRMLFPAWEGGLRRRPTLAYLRELEQSEWLSEDELHARQLAALQKLCAHARDAVPFYRDRLGDFDVRALEDLTKIPILTKDEARAGTDARRSTKPPFVAVSKATSGTMGQPLAFGYDLDSEHWRQATKLRGYSWAGYNPGARSLHYWGAPIKKTPRFTKAKIATDRWLRREHYIDCGRRGEAELAHAVAEIRRLEPEVILCYAQAGADLARYVNERGGRDWETIPIICGAERVAPADRAAMEQAFGPAVFETFGCREFMLIAAECGAHAGLHVSMENLIVEIVVREGGVERPAAPGELGEVVITDLHNYGMPFIRYANGDLAVAARPGRCACGRGLARLESIEGRVTETLRDGSGRRVNGLVFNVMFSMIAGAVRQFQAVQHKDGSITLKMVPTPKLDAAVRANIKQTCAKYLEGVEVRLELVDDIPIAASGKRQVVVVER